MSKFKLRFDDDQLKYFNWTKQNHQYLNDDAMQNSKI